MLMFQRDPRSHRLVFSKWLLILGLLVLVLWPRLTALNQYLIVDEADRWRWATEFVQALNRGDLAGTRVGDGYPGIVPVWAESAWILLEAARRSVVEGQWIGEIGLGHLIHEWDRTGLLYQQRLPIVLMNTVLTLAIIWAVWRLFGGRVALVSGVLIALDPFYLSDSRVNRAEAVITGLMTLSILSLIFYYQRRQFRYVVISGVLGGLSFLTKIQALAILPVVALAGLLIYWDRDRGGNKWTQSLLPTPYSLLQVIKFGGGWALAAGLAWFLLWPSMWVTPLETLGLVYNYATRKVGAEGVSLFFLGETYQDADPGLLFYPFVFLMRITPLALVGLLAALLRFMLSALRHSSVIKPSGDDPFTTKGTFILVSYVLLYALVMTFGSHKQDRYLMPVFLGLDILAAMGLLYLWVWLKSRIGVRSKEYEVRGDNSNATPYFLEWILFAGLVAFQVITVLPHHPYYYSYFNPLFGGGQTAARTLRIGWGEGMDQVGDYLAAKPNSRELVVSTRFTHNMLNFRGEVIALGEDGRWTQADYIVLYIQQVQRRLDPSPAFIDYFQARTPEKVITLGDIDYAWIYPIPFSTPANPQVSRLPGEAVLLGYSWESAPPTIRLLWKNLGAGTDRQPAARLIGELAETDWTACQPDPAFTVQATTPGAYIESLCAPDVDSLPAGIYTVEFGLAADGAAVTPFLFPEGWQVAQITAAGEVKDTSDLTRLEAIAAGVVPPEAVRLDRIYDRRLRLVAYRLDPARPHPGQSVELSLYWQAVNELLEPLHLTVQLADSRLLPLGRSDSLLAPPTHGAAGRRWLPGEINVTHHQFELASNLDPPLAGRLEVTLRDEAEIALPPTDAGKNKLEPVVDYFTVAPPAWPVLDKVAAIETGWHNTITMRGVNLPRRPVQPGESIPVTLFWQTDRPLPEDYVVFVHMLDQAGQIKAQNDSLPRAGAYPTPWWLPGVLIEDTHLLDLSPDLPAGNYQLVVGLYTAADGARLLLADGRDSLVIGQIKIQ
jgi:hypothetical protein